MSEFVPVFIILLKLSKHVTVNEEQDNEINAQFALAHKIFQQSCLLCSVSQNIF